MQNDRPRLRTHRSPIDRRLSAIMERGTYYRGFGRFLGFLTDGDDNTYCIFMKRRSILDAVLDTKNELVKYSDRDVFADYLERAW